MTAARGESLGAAEKGAYGTMTNERKKDAAPTLVSINRRTFIQVTALLAALLIAAIALTFIVPRGDFGALPDGSPDYTRYIPRPDKPGIPIWRGLLAPVLVFFSSDGLTLIMLSLFLFVVSAAFQVMNDAGGVDALVSAVSARFRSRKKLLLALMSFLFYCFGAFLGLFEEMLTMLPIIAALCLTLGYDSFTGFLCSIIACGFGFAGAITNPFTVLLASQIIGANPMEHIWLRVAVFLVMFGLLMAYLFHYVGRLERNPDASLTKAHDARLRAENRGAEKKTGENAGRVRAIYAAFLLIALGLIIVSSLLEALRAYTVVILIAYFLIFGLAAGALACGSAGKALRSFGRGLWGALPTLVFIALASSIKFVFEAGGIMPTIASRVSLLAEGESGFGVAVAIYLVVLLLEFFISSSSAKAILVMGLLRVVNVGLSKPLLVLLFTFGDGYTNVLFPTCPVLLISLSMIRMDYFTWIRKSFPLFLANFLLVLAFIALAVATGY